jgi:hypothetical protein
VTRFERGRGVDPRRPREATVQRRRGRQVVALTAVAGLVACGIAFGMWPRNDRPRDPDAVVVLGGASYERVDLGVELRERFDAVLVLSASAIAFGEARGIRCGDGVVCIHPQPRNTAGEAREVAALAAENNWDEIAVATTRFHTTRARVLFRQCLGDRVTVIGAPPLPGGPNRGFHNYLRETIGTAAAMTFSRAC